jgi:hypothetical protein
MSEPRARTGAEPTQIHAPVAGADADAEHRAYVEAWERTHPGQPFPRPWQTPEDASGWRAVARGRNWPARPDSDVELRVVLSPDDYTWLARQATLADLRPSHYLAQLVTSARTEDRSPKASADCAPATHSVSR